MKLCLGQATICETETLQAIEAAARGGFTHIDLWWPRLQTDLQATSAEAIRAAADNQGIALASLSGLGLELVGSDDLWAESLGRCDGVFAVASALGVSFTSFTPGVTHEPAHEGLYAMAIDRLARLTQRASERNLHLALEFRSDSRWLTSLPTAAAVVSQVGSKHLGLSLDVFHYYCGPSKLEDLSPGVVGLIHAVHWSDIIGTPRETARDHDRILPGEGDFDLRSLMACLSGSDYDILHVVEAPNPLLWTIAADRVADMAYQALFRVCCPGDSDS